MTEINKNGCEVQRNFFLHRDRYKYDFTICTAVVGWVQYATEQDASYFGVWVHPETMTTVTYCEGDETTVIAPTLEAFNAELASMAEFYGNPPPSMKMYDGKGGVTYVYDERGFFGRNIPTD